MLANVIYHLHFNKKLQWIRINKNKLPYILVRETLQKALQIIIKQRSPVIKFWLA